jgi:hypothetical protein
MANIIEAVIVIIVVTILGFLAIDKVISDNINKSKEYEKRLEECFKQEPRTKDCEFVLWRHENR